MQDPLGGEEPLEKGMASHSNILAWRIPWTEEPGGLQSLGLQRVRHDWATISQLVPFLRFPLPSLPPRTTATNNPWHPESKRQGTPYLENKTQESKKSNTFLFFYSLPKHQRQNLELLRFRHKTQRQIRQLPDGKERSYHLNPHAKPNPCTWLDCRNKDMSWDFPSGPSGQDSACQGRRWSVVGELRSQVPRGVAK